MAAEPGPCRVTAARGVVLRIREMGKAHRAVAGLPGTFDTSPRSAPIDADRRDTA